MGIDHRSAALMAILLLVPTAVTQGSPEPTVVVYSGPDTRIAEALASLIEQDGRLEAEILVVSTPSAVSLATVLPTTQCIVIYSDHGASLLGLDLTLPSVFERGVGLVGMRDACYERSAGNLPKEVFPVYGNFSVVRTSMAEERVRTYTRVESSELTSGLPERLQLLSLGTFMCADMNGSYIQVPGEHRVLYKDEETGSPLVLTYENEGGGRSVAMPGIMVVNTPRVDVYYGNLFADENFVKLFTNSVLWAAASPGFARVMQEIEGKLAGIENEKHALKEEAELARKSDAQRRLVTIVVVWVLGLAVCGVITKRFILKPV